MMYHGILNIYKEKGYTSHDVVARLRGILLATLPLPSAPAVPPRVSPCTYLRSLPTRPVDPTGHGAGQVITTPGNILSQ